MASYLRPRRGKKDTAIEQNIILMRGEVFFEAPDSGVGTGAGKIKIGDGFTNYANLPYFMEATDVENSTVAFTDSTVATDPSNNVTYLNNIKPANSIKTIFTNLKQLLVNLNKEVDDVSKNILPKVYPVGSFYINASSDANPRDILGFGTWERVKDRFILGAGDNYGINSDLGQDKVTLNVNQLPAHSHGGNTSTNGARVQFAIYHSDLKGGTAGDTRSNVLSGNVNGSWSGGYNGYTGYGNDCNHNHSLSITNTGGNQAHNNMPPYIAAYVWKRIE